MVGKVAALFDVGGCGIAPAEEAGEA